MPPISSGLGFIGLSVPSGLLPEYIHIPKHELPVFEEKRGKEVASLRPQFDTFPWICWYIWKVRNEKLFSRKDVSPIDILQHTSLEAECWRKANENKGANKDHNDPPTMEVEIVSHWIPWIPTCQIDASWINNGSVSCLGWNLRIKWAQNSSDYGRVTGASQLCMLRWKGYFGKLHVWETRGSLQYGLRRTAWT